MNEWIKDVCVRRRTLTLGYSQRHLTKLLSHERNLTRTPKNRGLDLESIHLLFVTKTIADSMIYPVVICFQTSS